MATPMTDASVYELLRLVPLFADIPVDMTEEEIAIANSIPSARVAPAPA